MFSYFTLFTVYLSTMFAPLSIPFLKSSAEFIQPNTSSMLYGGEYYNVEWNMSNNVNLQFQIYNETQDDWVSHINNNHFLSIVIDQTTNQYNWSVPLYLSQYCKIPVVWYSISRHKSLCYQRRIQHCRYLCKYVFIG